MKGSASKITIKFYNSKMGGVDLMDQLKSVYQLDRRLKVRFYLCLFFDLFDLALVNSFLVYKSLHNRELCLKDFNICIASKLIGLFVSPKLPSPNYRPSKCNKVPSPESLPSLHLPIFLETR